jgi:hypothetical protein
MSIVLEVPRTGQRAARPSIREVRLLGGPRSGPGCSTGARLTLSGRSYRVAATQTQGDDGSPRYLHLADELGESGFSDLKSKI